MVDIQMSRHLGRRWDAGCCRWGWWTTGRCRKTPWRAWQSPRWPRRRSKVLQGISKIHQQPALRHTNMSHVLSPLADTPCLHSCRPSRQAGGSTRQGMCREFDPLVGP